MNLFKIRKEALLDEMDSAKFNFRNENKKHIFAFVAFKVNSRS